MKTILIVNTREKACAIHQYGINLFQNLSFSTRFHFIYCEPMDEGELVHMVRDHDADAILYNWHPTQKGWMQNAPFEVFRPVKNICILHEMQWERLWNFDAVLYSRPLEPSHPQWHRLPLVIPIWQANEEVVDGELPTFGVHGFGGAHADKVVKAVCHEYDRAFIRLLLPPAHYGDQPGNAARYMKDQCLELVRHRPGVQLHFWTDWLDQNEMLQWLEFNDMNIYLRDTAVPWHGVSAAMCAALAVERPMAINRCPSFEHLWHCQPSICVEDRSLKEILATGIEPLKPIYKENTADRLCNRVGDILEGIL